MERNFRGLVAALFSIGLVCTSYSIPLKTYSQSQQKYTIANTKPGGGPRLPIEGSSTGISKLTSLDNTQIN